MGGVLSAGLTCLGSLAGGCCASMACKACSCACVMPVRAASVLYISIVSLSLIAALLFEFRGGDIVIGGGTDDDAVKTDESWLTKAKEMAMGAAGSAVTSAPKEFLNKRFWCSKEHPGGWVLCCGDVCGGVFSVYRFSFALAVFFGLMMLLTAFKSRFASKAHRGFWIGKVALLLALLVCTLFISNDFFVGYREITRYLSFGFLLLQIVLIIDFAYTWNEKWIEYDEASDNEGICGWKLAIVLCSVFLYIGSVVAWVLMYVYFGKSECPGQQTVISFTLILCVTLTGISCSRVAPHGTLLTSAAVTCYATYLCYSGLASHPDAACNPLVDQEGESGTSLVVGVVAAGISLWSMASSISKTTVIGKDTNADLDKPLDASNESSSDDDEVTSESWWSFHLMMLACSVYFAMLLTDWSSQPPDIHGIPLVRGAAQEYNVSLSTFWVKVVSQWVALLVYGWTLLAPYMLRETRDFGVEFDF